MPLSTIPVLDESYPLFDWADYQSSRDALVSGTPTRYFAKEAWNAIVDSLNNALTAAGLSWDNTYTTVSGAKITQAYGKLTAQKFNSVRHNIDWPAPLGWAWARDENFRGYVGREDFHGRSVYGKACDKVYPEYIIELARKMNLLLEIMRDTAPMLEAEAHTLSSVNIQADVLAGVGVSGQAHLLAKTEVQAVPITGQAAFVSASVIGTSKVSSGVEVAPSAQGTIRLKSQRQMLAAGNSKPAIDAGLVSHSAPVKIAVEGTSQPYLDGSVSYVASVTASAEAVANPYVAYSAGSISNTAVTADAMNGVALPAEAKTAPKSRTYAELMTGEAHDVSAFTGTASTVFTDLSKSRARKLVATQKSAVNVSAELAPDSFGVPIVINLQAGNRISCKLSSAWWPPIWVNGGLWIRQSHSVTQNEIGELVIL